MTTSATMLAPPGQAFIGGGGMTVRLRRHSRGGGSKSKACASSQRGAQMRAATPSPQQSTSEPSPRPRRRRYTIRRVETGGKGGGRAGEGERRYAEGSKDGGDGGAPLRWSSEQMFGSVVTLDRAVWRQLDEMLSRLLGEELVLTISALGSRLLRLAKLTLGRLVNPTIEDELVSLEETQQLSVEFGVVRPNSADKFHIDPLDDWKRTKVTFFLDSTGNRVYLHACGAVGAGEFREFEGGGFVEVKERFSFDSDAVSRPGGSSPSAALER